MNDTSVRPSLPHKLDRTMVIEAPRDLVFRFFTDPARWAIWWGTGSTIDARPGGALLIRYPDGTEVVGEVMSVDAPSQIVFTYGYASGKLVPPGGSLVTIRLEPEARGTRLRLQHDLADASVRDMHVQGWRFQLSLFSNVVSNELLANAASTVDAWHAVWTNPDAEARRRELTRLAGGSVRFRDRFSHIDGPDELNEHITAALRFMPGLRLERRGEIRQCQNTVLADWIAVGPDNQQRGRGTNVYAFDADGKIESVVGLWAQ